MLEPAKPSAAGETQQAGLAQAASPREAPSGWAGAPATTIVVLLNVALFALPALLGGVVPKLQRVLIPALWNTPRLVAEEGHVWQLLTANFVHGGFLHLAVNMVFVLWFGSHLERRLGSWRFLSFYLMTGIFAHLVYDFGAPLFHAASTTGGASGCVLGIAVLHAFCFPTYELRLYGVIPVRFWWIVALFVISDISSFFPPGGIPWINSVVHLGGAAFGALYWLLYARKIVPRQR